MPGWWRDRTALRDGAARLTLVFSLGQLSDVDLSVLSVFDVVVK